MLEPVNFSNGNYDVERHSESGVNGSGHEVGRKDCGVPAGHDCGRKIKADDAVDREHERRGQPGQQQIRDLVALPMRGGVTPAEGEESVDFFLPEISGAISQSRQIRHQTEIPK